MGNINSVIIEGNLVKAAELSSWSDGTPYCRFTIANNESYKDNAGNWVDIPSFFDCVIRGKYGESMHKHLLKGRHVTVEGRLKQSKWKDKDGVNHFAVIIKVNEVSLAPGSFQAKEQFQNENPQYNSEPPAEHYEPQESDPYSDSEIPF